MQVNKILILRPRLDYILSNIELIIKKYLWELIMDDKKFESQLDGLGLSEEDIEISKGLRSNPPTEWQIKTAQLMRRVAEEGTATNNKAVPCAACNH